MIESILRENREDRNLKAIEIYNVLDGDELGVRVDNTFIKVLADQGLMLEMATYGGKLALVGIADIHYVNYYDKEGKRFVDFRTLAKITRVNPLMERRTAMELKDLGEEGNLMVLEGQPELTGNRFGVLYDAHLENHLTEKEVSFVLVDDVFYMDQYGREYTADAFTDYGKTYIDFSTTLRGKLYRVLADDVSERDMLAIIELLRQNGVKPVVKEV